jgi:SEC-C motif-containing protein
MASVPFYSILSETRWAAVASAVHRAHARRGPGRNAPCPCGSGKKFKSCCGRAVSSPPEQWLDESGALRFGSADGLDADTLRDALHMARIERARQVFEQSGSLGPLGPGRIATDWAAAASVLQADPERRAPLLDALRSALGLPLDHCLDYRRIVFDLVHVAQELGDLDAAIEAQRWWIDFLEDFGQRFSLRMEAMHTLHDLLVRAGRAEPTAAARDALLGSLLKPELPDRSALLPKMKP